MQKYQTKNWCEGGYWNASDLVHTTNECIEEEKDNFSGLYDSEGRPLYRVPQKLGYI